MAYSSDRTTFSGFVFPDLILLIFQLLCAGGSLSTMLFHLSVMQHTFAKFVTQQKRCEGAMRLAKGP